MRARTLSVLTLPRALPGRLHPADPTLTNTRTLHAHTRAHPAGILGYLSAAAERVVGHQFKGDATEPDWSKLGQRSIKGSISRKSDGHAKK